jgi:hypothetical protein
MFATNNRFSSFADVRVYMSDAFIAEMAALFPMFVQFGTTAANNTPNQEDFVSPGPATLLLLLLLQFFDTKTCVRVCAFYSNFPRISDSRNKNSSSSSILTLVPPYSGNKTWSPTFKCGTCSVPVTSFSPGPTAKTDPSLGSLVLSDGKKMPAAVCVSLGARRTKTRSPSGAKERYKTFREKETKEYIVRARHWHTCARV